ncbi:MAG: hypothetical protein IMX01_07285 [Limnochordaceae bacterium]|nr:hypothetical protein [Limnochordaceae bacterium]
MCGICGLAFADPRPVPDPTILNRMCQDMVHRGPDERRLHTEPGLGLGFQRLSIIDRQGGHQPLSNEDETLQLVCNGEIYNYRELRQELIAFPERRSTCCRCRVIFTGKVVSKHPMALGWPLLRRSNHCLHFRAFGLSPIWRLFTVI